MSFGVCYCGTWGEASGYAQANRNFIASLFMAKVNLTTELVVQMSEKPKTGWIGELCQSLEGRKIDYKIKIIHLTPDFAAKHIEPNKYNIFHLFWEVDKLPKEWINPCNQANEIWTASEQQAQMIKASGVKTPIYWFGQPIDTMDFESRTTPFRIPNFDGLTFYSIFQWIERKNPKALLTAYWKAFEGNKDVTLVIKTYGVNYSDSEANKIRYEIEGWKKELKLLHYPRVQLITQLLSTQDVFRLHKTGKVFVSTSRGEGWSIPAVEAMVMGNPVVSIDKTGFADLLPKELFYPIACQSTQVKQVSTIPWYTPDQNWLDIDQEELISTLRNIYNDVQQADNKGKAAQKFVRENFNYWTVGQQMKERLQEIERFL